MRKDDPLALQESISHDDLFQLSVIFTNQDMAVHKFSGWSGCKFDKLNIAATYNLPYIVSHGRGTDWVCTLPRQNYSN